MKNLIACLFKPPAISSLEILESNLRMPDCIPFMNYPPLFSNLFLLYQLLELLIVSQMHITYYLLWNVVIHV